MFSLGSDQFIRITVSAPFGAGDTKVRFRRINYQRQCAFPLCGGIRSSQSTTDPTTLASGDAISFDITPVNGEGIRGVALSNNPNVRVNAVIVNRITGDVISFAGDGLGSSHIQP